MLAAMKKFNIINGPEHSSILQVCVFTVHVSIIFSAQKLSMSLERTSQVCYTDIDNFAGYMNKQRSSTFHSTIAFRIQIIDNLPPAYVLPSRPCTLGEDMQSSKVVARVIEPDVLVQARDLLHLVVGKVKGNRFQVLNHASRVAFGDDSESALSGPA